MPHSHSGQVRRHPKLADHLEVSHATIVNRPDGSRVTYRATLAIPAGAAPEVVAAAFGEVARRSLLAAMEDE